VKIVATGKESVMAIGNSNLETPLKHIRTIAHSLMILWVSWWIFFGFSSSLSAGISPASVLLHAAFPGFIFLLTAIVAWWFEEIGGKLLIFEGLFILVVFPAIAAGAISFGGILFVILTMALPPILAGILLRTNWQKL
jgi:hypothetical protein